VFETGAPPPQTGGVGFGRGQFGFGAGNIQAADLAVAEQAVDQAQVLPAQFDGALQQVNFGVEGAQSEIVAGEVGVQGQAKIFVIGGGRLVLGGGGLDRAPHPPPKIDLPAEVEGYIEDGGGEAAAAGGQGIRGATAGDGRIEVDAWEQVGFPDAGGGAGLLDPGDSRLEALVGSPGATLQIVQGRIAVNLPSRLPRQGIGGGRLLPGGAFAESGNGARFRPAVVRAEGAGGRQKQDRASERQSDKGHCCHKESMCWSMSRGAACCARVLSPLRSRRDAEHSEAGGS